MCAIATIVIRFTPSVLFTVTHMWVLHTSRMLKAMPTTAVETISRGSTMVLSVKVHRHGCRCTQMLVVIAYTSGGGTAYCLIWGDVVCTAAI